VPKSGWKKTRAPGTAA